MQASMLIVPLFLEIMLLSTINTLQGKIPPLYGASLGGNPKVVEYLLDHGADVNQPTDVSNVCLHNNYLFHTTIKLYLNQNISNFNVNLPSFMVSNQKCWLITA